MRGLLAVILSATFGLLAPPAPADGRPGYAWLADAAARDSIAERIQVPTGYARVPVAPDSFADWLRRLRLKPAGAAVRLFDGGLKARQDVHAAVVDIDTGRRDLQQCADAVMRLRAEYLFATGRAGEIGFDFTSGDRAEFQRWAQGWRPHVAGSRVHWQRLAGADATHASLRRYLDTVFAYAGSHSLARELASVPAAGDLAVGDVYIRGGFPGHAVLVVDLAVDPGSGRKLFLLAQSYMPAQDVHVLRNLAEPTLDPWYALGEGPALVTPEWRFGWSDRRRF